MIFHKTDLTDAMLVEAVVRGDERGSFARTMDRQLFEEQGLKADFVQQNTSVSAWTSTSSAKARTSTGSPEKWATMRSSIWL